MIAEAQKYRDSAPPRSPRLDRQPPHNIECEKGVLGAILIEPAAMNEIRVMLSAGDFFRETHAKLYGVICDLYDVGKPIDRLAVYDAMVADGWDSTEALELITDVVDSVSHAASVAYHAKIVRAKAKARQLIETLTEQLGIAYANDRTSTDLIAGAQEAVFAIGDDSATKAAATLHEAAMEALDALDRRANGECDGIDTGIGDLDFLLDGLKPGRFYVIAARPSIGKSALGWQIADHAACERGAGTPTLFVSLEMTQGELLERFFASRARMSGDRFRRPGDFSADERQALDHAVRVVAKSSRLLIDDTPSLTVAQLAARCRRAKLQHGIGLIVVDYLQYIDGPRLKGESREQEISRISRRLKAVAKELDIPIVALCQLNRGVEGRADHRPMLSDLRESGQIEQDAHAVILIHRPDYYDASDRPGLVELIVAKHRGGPTGKLELWFKRSESRFDPVPPGGL